MAKLLPRSSPTGNQQISGAKVLSACPSQKGASKQWSFHRASLADPVLHLSFCQCCYLFMGALSSFLLFPPPQEPVQCLGFLNQRNKLYEHVQTVHTHSHLWQKTFKWKSVTCPIVYELCTYKYIFMLYLVLAAHHTKSCMIYTKTKTCIT